MSKFPDRSRGAGWIGFALAAAAVLAPGVAHAEPYIYVARAQLVEVGHSFANQTTATVPGAGVRAFQDPDAGGTERFEIRWYANPPGIPPGAIILLESIQERSPVVKNHVLRTTGKSAGHVRSTIEIPADEIRRGGRVVQWRVRVIWRGQALATQTSPNWEG